MPRYDYECERCGHVEEKVFKMAEKPDLIKCPVCCGCSVSIISRIADVRADWNPYIDFNLGDQEVEVRGRGHRKELMKKAGLEESGRIFDANERKQKMQWWRHDRAKELGLPPKKEECSTKKYFT